MGRLGCLPLLIVLFLIIALPIFFIGMLNTALVKLHLNAPGAMLVIVGIMVGSVVNIPIARIPRGDDVPVQQPPPFWPPGMWPAPREMPKETVVAVNLGGCIIPSSLAIYELLYLIADGSALPALAAAVAATTLVCYLLARPVAGLGILMPGLVPALVAALMALMLAPASAPPVAFIAGVAGPLVGADLLHLREMTRTASAIVSVGGAGTFDGILLSGIVAAYLA